MGFDPSTLFFAAGISAVALALTMFGAWLQNRLDVFLIGWMLGMSSLGAGAVIYSAYPPQPVVILICLTLQTVGFVSVYLSARLFTGTPVHWRIAIILALAAVAAVIVPISSGRDGVGVAIFNVIAAVLLFLCAQEYWRAREQSPLSIVALSGLYAIAGVSFLACGLVLIYERQWQLVGRPANWAESFNAVVSIAGITGIGALSLGLNHSRMASRLSKEAATDALTGLMNRRALFSNFVANRLRPGDAVIVFDLDRFKSINDRYGHRAGDITLHQFAEELRSNARPQDLVARLGGEEFVLVMRQVSVAEATATAERIRAAFSATPLKVNDTAVLVTASAGVAFAVSEDDDFEHVMHRADLALYRAKNSGRDRVLTELQVVA
ncbi:GGDEF domain-containing protein [Nitratireductor aestuarii]|uniref:diguanylate cyclase n=1 Tax=Nitratireductor aestuarii TaxID=1735103 RepID=A0A916RJU2_9HYPH|nr:GGDEF domain-containing protein [Nitratireductor aestuarii]GGA59072.1 GGDEF domain-containing protein [Nitratireductor aestuarii]